MPRPRDIVGLKTTDIERKRAILEKAVEVHDPYRIFRQSKDLGFKNKGWCVVYVSPHSGQREIMFQDLDKVIAKDFQGILIKAWLQGYTAIWIE